jgi:hypothetical protein
MINSRVLVDGSTMNCSLFLPLMNYQPLSPVAYGFLRTPLGTVWHGGVYQVGQTTNGTLGYVLCRRNLLWCEELFPLPKQDSVTNAADLEITDDWAVDPFIRLAAPFCFEQDWHGKQSVLPGCPTLLDLRLNSISGNSLLLTHRASTYGLTPRGACHHKRNI